VGASGGVLITGATGFLGANLVHLLAEEGEEVHCLVRTGRELSAPLAGHERIRVMRADLWDAQIPFCRGVVIHCAALRPPSRRLQWETNVLATQALSLQAVERDCHFIYISTQSVYGLENGLPASESEQPRPNTSYGRSKLAGERVVQAAYRGASPSWTALRLVRIYGKMGTARYEGVLAAFLDAARSGRPAAIDGAGSFLMDFVHIRDACCAVVAARRAVSRLRGVYNVGSGGAVSVLELARTVRTHCPEFRWEMDDSRPSGRGMWLDTSRFHSATGWRPQVPLRDGISEALQA
jgi:nucleoside-diphosphate-sugar epimerase